VVGREGEGVKICDALRSWHAGATTGGYSAGGSQLRWETLRS
jgi:hypothetical protein